MKLRDWLKRENVSIAEMATRIERTGEAVRRYAGGERIPDRDTMPRIVRETGGEVTANDFFDIDVPATREPSAAGDELESPDTSPADIAAGPTDPEERPSNGPSCRTPAAASPDPGDAAAGAFVFPEAAQ